MKKHIIITGVPRAGKSTVSSRVVARLPYQHISMDSVIAGFERCFPDTGVNTYAPMSSMDILKNISRKMAPFLRAMMDSGEYDEQDYGMCIDMYQLLPEDYVNFIDPEKCGIYYFITSNVTPEERFAIQKKYDTPKDYSYHLSDEERMEGCHYLVEQSKLMREQCEKYGLPYFETAHEREKVIEAFLTDLVAEKI
ncbi:MAG: hypothetical protein J1E06_04970 [Acutalibacter sp.]|nr:hypothetical protein [Acutalibacter sp.]